jgi:hypothetical protein
MHAAARMSWSRREFLPDSLIHCCGLQDGGGARASRDSMRASERPMIPLRGVHSSKVRWSASSAAQLWHSRLGMCHTAINARSSDAQTLKQVLGQSEYMVCFLGLPTKGIGLLQSYSWPGCHALAGPQLVSAGSLWPRLESIATNAPSIAAYLLKFQDCVIMLLHNDATPGQSADALWQLQALEQPPGSPEHCASV